MHFVLEFKPVITEFLEKRTANDAGDSGGGVGGVGGVR